MYQNKGKIALILLATFVLLVISGCKPSVGPTSFTTRLGGPGDSVDDDPAYQGRQEEQQRERERKEEQRKRDEWNRKEENTKQEFAKVGLDYEKRPYVPEGTPTIGPSDDIDSGKENSKTTIGSPNRRSSGGFQGAPRVTAPRGGGHNH